MMENQLLPVGTRIIFKKDLIGNATGDSPACIYAQKGGKGVIVGHGTVEGYWVTWDEWPHKFGASETEFSVESKGATE